MGNDYSEKRQEYQDDRMELGKLLLMGVAIPTGIALSVASSIIALPIVVPILYLQNHYNNN